MSTSLSYRWLVIVDGEETKFTYLKHALAHLTGFGIVFKYDHARSAFSGREDKKIRLRNGDRDIWLERITVLSATGERV